jgi:hypothetical protein
MDWFAFAGSIFRRIPFEKLLVPPRDSTKETRDFIKTLREGESATQVATAPEAAVTTQKPKGVAYSGSPGIVTREGVDPQRIAWQDSLIRGELWLLEGHLKNNCKGCGGDVECCWKHCQNIMDAAQETQSMTSEPLYQEAISIAEHVQPFVHPEDIKAGKFLSRYPTLAIEVSQVRTQFDSRVMSQAHNSLTLDEAKKLAADEAAKEVEKRWPSQERK